MSVTFDYAAASYLLNGGEGRYLPKIIPLLVGRDVRTIPPAEIHRMAMRLYPDVTNATRNRAVIGPMRAVMHHAHDMGWCNALRIRQLRHVPKKRPDPANYAWFNSFISQCDKDNLPHLAALCIFMNHTAARVSEAIGLTGEHVNLRERTALLLKTKTDVDATAFLTDELVYRLQLIDLQPGKRVFTYTNRSSVNERIKVVCRRAGIKYKSSHIIGRHSFGTNVMRLGVDVKTAMVAGRWKTASIFLGTYVHTRNAGRMVAERLNVYNLETKLDLDVQ